MTAFLKLGEEMGEFFSEHDRLKAKVGSLEEVASSLKLTGEEWKRKFEVAELRLAEEQRLRERMERAGLTREEQFKQQISLLEAKADQAKELLRNAEGRATIAENRADELAQRLAAERAEREALQKEVDGIPARIQAEREDAESDISERFLYAMWLRHPEIDYSFMGPDAVKGVQRFEEDAREEEEAADRGEPSSMDNVMQLPQDVAPANQGANEALGDREFEDLFAPFADAGGKDDGAM